MGFTIGEEIRKKIEERGITNVSFAEKMGIGERNLYHFFKKTEIPLDQLIDASNVLDFDFIELYLKNSVKKLKSPTSYFEESAVEYKKTAAKKHEISLTVNIFGELSQITHAFPEFLQVIEKEARERGLHLG